MSARRASIVALILVLCGAPALAQPEGKKTDARAAPAPLRFPLSVQQMPYVGTIDRVNKSGAVQISPAANVAREGSGILQQGVTEGYYLGIVSKPTAAKLEGTRLVRVQVTEIGEDRVLQLQVARAAAEAIAAGEKLSLYRPNGVSTA